MTWLYGPYLDNNSSKWLSCGVEMLSQNSLVVLFNSESVVNLWDSGNTKICVSLPASPHSHVWRGHSEIVSFWILPPDSETLRIIDSNHQLWSLQGSSALRGEPDFSSFATSCLPLSVFQNIQAPAYWLHTHKMLFLTPMTMLSFVFDAAPLCAP